MNIAKKADKEVFHYTIPTHLVDKVKIGCRVMVPLNNQNREGYIIDFPRETPIENLKPIKELIDVEPIITRELLAIALWVSETYLCSIYRVLEYIIPPYARTKPVEWVKLVASPKELKVFSLLDNELKKLISILEGGPQKLTLVRKKLGGNYDSFLKDLEKRKIIEVFLDYQFKGQSKYQTIVKATIQEEELIGVLETLKRAKKQQEIIKYLVENGPTLATDICQALKTSAATITSLEKKGFLEKIKVQEKRIPEIDQAFKRDEKFQLNIDQQNAVKEIVEELEKGNGQTFLLHGVTGSGKTEVYIRAIEKALEQGRGALVLVPEISLTPQTIGRFSSVLKEKVVVLHSALSQGERLDAWNDLRKGIAKVAVGVRSAIFAPVQNLGLIIIDEEHEGTFKQSEPDPRYHAREVALERVGRNKGILILGSATPSIDSYFRAKQGEYKLLELPERASKHNLPQAIVVDLREEFLQGNKSIFSATLKQYINEALENKEQIILFLNRRGYSTFVLCRECGKTIDCKNCAISLTYHAYSQELKCHYCSYTQSIPKRCPHCGSSFIKYFGTGTQLVEGETRKIWPEIRVERLDVDTTQNKDAHQKILARFSRGETDLLIGTQMVTKGLDFPNVTVVGIMAADTSLNLPDYTSSEKTFQLITQVAGRAGRGEKRGRVVIQTYNPDHYSIVAGQEQNYHKFYQQELQTRKLMEYPPYSFLVRILITGLKERVVQESCLEISQFLNQKYKGCFEIFGPAPAPIEKIKNRYRWQIILKGQDVAILKEGAQEGAKFIENLPENQELRIIIDIGPQSIL